MIYPVVVISVAVAILSFIMIFIIPKFEKIFKDFGIKLPWITQFLIDTSRQFVKFWYIIPLIPMAIWLMLKLIRLNKMGAYFLDKIKLLMPVAGGIVQKTIVARTMRTLGTLISSGVPILEALAIVKETCMNASTRTASRTSTIRSAKAKPSPSRSRNRGSWTTWSST